MKTEKRFLCTIDEEDGEFVTLKMVPVDLVALLKLADEMDAYTKCDDERCGREMPPSVIHDYARRIREALGVVR